MEKQRVIEIKCVNSTGVLNRITALFFARGISIDSIMSCETKNEDKYVIFVELTYDWKTVGFICRLLKKLVDVIDVKDITEEIHTETQTTLVKVKCTSKKECLKQFENFNIEVINEKNGKFYIEYANSKEKTEAFISVLDKLGSVTYLKSGRMFLK